MARRLAQILAFALAVATCTRTPPAPTGGADPFATKLDLVMTDALEKRGLPGSSLVIVQGNAITYAKGFGKANLETGEAMTDSTPTVIGSTSKPLTALGVLRLGQLGKVALDTPIVRYVPELRFRDRRGAAITLRHLLTNRAGLVVGFSGPAYQRPADTGDSSLARLAQDMTRLPLLFAPGTGYAYSNRGWALAGYVIQRVSGESVEAFMRREVLEPLGMTQSTLEFWKVPNLAQGYVEGRMARNHPSPASLTRAYGPSGMFVSTPRDMGRLLVAMLNGGRTVDGRQFLSPELIAEALRPQAEAESELGGPTRYGLGWEVDSMLGTTTIKKAGSVHTLVSLWVMVPEQKLGMVFAFNREDYQVIPLVGNVFTIMNGGNAEPFPAWAAGPEVSPPSPVAVSATTRSHWVGRYDTQGGDVTVWVEGDSLLADLDGSRTLLVPTSDSTAALTSDRVAFQGKTLRFGRRGTLWSGADSLGVKR